MTIRKATPQDAPAVIGLVNAVARDDVTLGIDAFPLSPEQEAAFLRLADPSVHLSLVACDEAGNIVGHLYASRGILATTRHVGSLAIAVARSARRRGIGRSLLSGCLAWAAGIGVRKMTLSVLAQNAPAIALFESAGFMPEALRRGQFHIDGHEADELLMAQWVDAREEYTWTSGIA